jgi:hypothetical protein
MGVCHAPVWCSKASDELLSSINQIIFSLSMHVCVCVMLLPGALRYLMNWIVFYDLNYLSLRTHVQYVCVLCSCLVLSII